MITGKGFFARLLFFFMAMILGLNCAYAQKNSRKSKWIDAYFSKLPVELNKPYKVSEFENYDLQLGDKGTLKMKDLKMIWSGITKVNNEKCALIQYRSFANPVESKTNAMNTRGRSCYWGSISISLEDKQVEQFTINEDIILEMTFPGNPTQRRMNIQREVIFEKIMEKTVSRKL